MRLSVGSWYGLLLLFLPLLMCGLTGCSHSATDGSTAITDRSTDLGKW